MRQKAREGQGCCQHLLEGSLLMTSNKGPSLQGATNPQHHRTEMEAEAQASNTGTFGNILKPYPNRISPVLVPWVQLVPLPQGLPRLPPLCPTVDPR